MKRLMLTIAKLLALAAILASSIPFIGTAASSFDQPLSPDQKALQALNRLTFGARPGDLEEVKRIGVAKWIEIQLHPDRIAENPALDAKLKPLETLRMNVPDIVKEYTPQDNQMVMFDSPMMMANNLLGPQEMQKLRNGTAEQRKAKLAAIEPDKRWQVLLALGPQGVEDLPEYKKEFEDAQTTQREQQQKRFRMLNPQLQDLLNPDQVTVARSGNKEQLAALFAYLDPDKRGKVAGALPPQALAMFPELRREAQKGKQPRQVASEDLKEAKVFRAIYSNRQLEEVLVDFWYNHFNVDQNKNVLQQIGAQNLEHLLIGSYERDAIRPHVLGHFKDLLLATARHPAMLYYLDNWESVAPDAFNVGPFAPNRGVLNGVPNSVLPGPLARVAHGLNENYGREVMELHTLGVKGGYTQDDVIAVARCFTGWTVRSTTDPEFVFAPFMHDFGEKMVLGHKIPAGGAEHDGLAVIDILAHHPSTAKFISRKLAQRFVTDDPPQALIDRMAQTFLKSDGDIRAVLETLFTSPEFFSEGAWQAKVKSPFEMVVSAVRAMGGEATDAFALVQKVSDLGQPLYAKLEPTGYPNTGDMWLSTSGAMGRMNFSAALASGLVPGVTVDSAKLAKDPPAVARQILGRDASPQTQSAIDKGLDGQERSPAFIASLVLGAPDFQRR